MIPCTVVEKYQYFGGTYYLCLQGRTTQNAGTYTNSIYHKEWCLLDSYAVWLLYETLSICGDINNRQIVFIYERIFNIFEVVCNLNILFHLSPAARLLLRQMNRSGLNLCSALQQWRVLSRHLWLQRRNYKAAMPVQLLTECCTAYLCIHDY